MTMLKKAAVAFAAVSMIAAPIAASAASIADLRVTSAIEGESEGFFSGSNGLIAVFALGAFGFGMAELLNGGNNNPTSR